MDKKTAWSVGTNGGLSDILVLRLDHGRDYFLPITARYHHSVFGSSFVKLIQKEHSTNESPSHLIDLVRSVLLLHPKGGLLCRGAVADLESALGNFFVVSKDVRNTASLSEYF